MKLFCFQFSKENGKKCSKKAKTPMKQKLSYSVGHIFNDLCSAVWFTYLLVYFNKVVGLSTSNTGVIFLVAQGADALLTPFMGMGCDRVICKALVPYGKRKVWHLFGTIFVAITWPFIFSPCLLCSPDSPEWHALLYYGVVVVVFHVGWASVQIAHLSLIPEIVRRASEVVEFNAIRSGLTFVCGIYIYCVTWILLGQANEENVSHKIWKEFTYLSFVVVGTGFVFSFLFHWGTVEPLTGLPVARESDEDQRRLEKESTSAETTSCLDPTEELTIEVMDDNKQLHVCKTWKDWFKDAHFYKMGVVYTCTRLVVNLSQSYFALYLTETLHFEKEAIAYFPLVILVSGALASLFVKRISKKLGNKWTFCLSGVVVICSCVWYYLQDSSSHAVYATAILMGCGNSIMLVTVLTMTADMIGNDKGSGGFVYSAMGFLDKGFVGVVVLVIQHFYPESPDGVDCVTCDQYVRLVFTLTPGVSALVALVVVLFSFQSTIVLTCKQRAELRDQQTQTVNCDGIRRGDERWRMEDEVEPCDEGLYKQLPFLHSSDL